MILSAQAQWIHTVAGHSEPVGTNSVIYESQTCQVGITRATDPGKVGSLYMVNIVDTLQYVQCMLTMAAPVN